MSNYDSYLKSQLCDSEEEIVQRPLPRIGMTVTGSGVSLKLKVNPRVRWSKIVAQWRKVRNTDEIGWPVWIEFPDGRIQFVTSLQDTVGQFSFEGDLKVGIGQTDLFTAEAILPIGSAAAITETSTPAEPLFLAESITEPMKLGDPITLAESITDPVTLGEAISSAPTELVKKFIKLRIINSSGKSMKMSVSWGCLISRLLLKSKCAGLRIMGNPVDLALNISVGDLLGELDEPIYLQEINANEPKLVLKKVKRSSLESSTAKKSKKEPEQSPFSPSSSSSFDPVSISYWEQVRASVPNASEEVDLYEDDDLILALALSESLKT